MIRKQNLFLLLALVSIALLVFYGPGEQIFSHFSDAIKPETATGANVYFDVGTNDAGSVYHFLGITPDEGTGKIVSTFLIYTAFLKIDLINEYF